MEQTEKLSIENLMQATDSLSLAVVNLTEQVGILKGEIAGLEQRIKVQETRAAMKEVRKR